jgi:hypothetical protein
MSQTSDRTDSSIQELNEQDAEQVVGGGTIYVPTEECPTCASGVDPTVLERNFQSTLLG